MVAVRAPPVSGQELTVVGHLSRAGWLHLSAQPAGRALLSQPSRWRLQLLEWDGKPLDRHRAELRANAQAADADQVPRRWPTDRLIVNTGQHLYTRLARCDHMHAALDKSPVTRLAFSRPNAHNDIDIDAQQMLGLRCVACQRMVNQFDASRNIQVYDDRSIGMQFSLPLPVDRAKWSETTSSARPYQTNKSAHNLQEQVPPNIPLDPFRFNGPCIVRLSERFPTLRGLNEIPSALVSGKHQQDEEKSKGWVCTGSSCDPVVVNATDFCSSCGTHRSWIERASRSQRAT